MNRKLICKILRNKFNDFVSSIDDQKTKELVGRNSLITGGSIVSLLTHEKVNDYDLYFTNKETTEAVASYYCKKFNVLHPNLNNKPHVRIGEGIGEEGRVMIWVQSAGSVSENGDDNYQYFEQLPDEVEANYVDDMLETLEIDSNTVKETDPKKYRPIFMSQNAITLSGKVQLVIRFYGDAEEIHKNYDFIHCTNYWQSSDGHLELKPLALESILTKQLIYQGSLYPICSVIRTRKFIKRGWNINAGQLLKMCFQISQLNLSDIEILSEQLTGVDAAYFYQVIKYCKSRIAEDKEFKVTAPYLCEVIDKIFG